MSHRARAPRWGFVAPALATRVSAPPTGSGWLHEIKYDGYRLQGAVSDSAVRLYTRSGLDWTAKFPTIARALSSLHLDDVLIDGEVAVARDDGRTDFAGLQRSLEGGKAAGVTYFVFDLLAAGDDDLRRVALTDRKARLDEVLARSAGPIARSPCFEGNGANVLEAFGKQGLEGLISKKLDAPYTSGRTDTWRKVKLVNEQEFIIVGSLPSSRGRPFASLMLADDVKGALTYRGNVGTGFNAATLASLEKQLAARERGTPPLAVPREAARGARWVEPTLVAQVKFTEFTRDGAVRHGVFLGLRQDKRANDVEAEMVWTRKDRAATATRNPRVHLTHPERVLFPEAALTKRDVALYYEAVAERMGAHVFGRPVSLVRAPDGVEAQTFFQRHAIEGAPAEIETVPITESDGDVARYLTLPDADALVACVQMSTVEIHLWGSRTDRLERPDRLVLDLDPDEALDFGQVKRAAFDIKALLESADLPSHAMLSGGKGIHIVLNLKRRHEWDEVKDVSAALAGLIADLDPQRFVATMSKAKRKGRIFIDYLRNQRGATAIAPYSTRARSTATIATPVSWRELASIQSSGAFTLKDMARRLSEPDPWSDYDAHAVSLTKGVRAKLGLR
jgi:bifunctional non-homologous end joining protein LigD